MNNNPMEIFQEEAPEVAKAFNGLIESLVHFKGLDAKTKQLIYIALKSAQGDATAISFHVPMAKQLGASKAEVTDAILLTLTVSGLTGVASCLSEAIKFFE